MGIYIYYVVTWLVGVIYILCCNMDVCGMYVGMYMMIGGKSFIMFDKKERGGLWEKNGNGVIMCVVLGWMRRRRKVRWMWNGWMTYLRK